MTVDRTEVERIAQLARLRLTDDEADRLVNEMNQILEHAMHLRRSADDTGAGAANEDGGPSGTRRVDIGVDDLHSELTSFAPSMSEGFFLVPPPPGVSAAGADPDQGDGSDGEDV